MRMLKIFLIYIILITIFVTPVFAIEGTIKGTDIRIRKEANTDSQVLEYVSEEDQIEIIEKEDNWYKITAKGVTGYVREDFIEISEEQIPTEEEITEQPPEEEPQEEITQPQEGNIKVHIIPSITSSIVGTINSTTEYTIGDTMNRWTYIYNDNISGWVVLDAVNEDNIEPEEPEQQVEEQPEEQEPEENLEEQTTQTTNKKGYINVDSANLREEPSTDSEVITGLIKNEEIIILEELDGWYKIEADGTTGYVADWLVSDKKVEVTNRSSTSQRTETTESTTTINSSTGNASIVEFAKQYLGCPYVYGGSGPKSFDCSGFTMYVYKQFGVSLPHTARGQSKYGTYIEKEDLQPGDIVFFKDYQTMDGIGHCGIYIGNGDFIHASSGTGYCVKISTLLSGSYYTRYETARRLF